MINPKVSNNILLSVFYALITLLSYFIFKDYGISIDEDNVRIIGFLALEDAYNFFGLLLPEKINLILLNQTSHHVDAIPSSGPIFNLIMALIEFFFNISDSQHQFYLRHFSTSLLFLLSSFFLFKIILIRYESHSIAFLGLFFLIITPRIFSNSFYNSNDIIFLSFALINLFTFIVFFKNQNFANSTVCALTTALTINSRIFGVIFFLLIIFTLLISILRTPNIKNKIIVLVNYIFFTFIFFVIFWPYLWTNPFQNLYLIFNSLNDHFLPIHIFFNNNFFYFKTVPWYYHLQWIFYTTPLPHILLFLLGLFFILKRFFFRLIKIEKNISYHDLWRGNKEAIDFIVILFLFVPLLFLIDSKKVSYGGWRHFFFIFPFIIIIICHSLYRIKIFIYKKKKIYFFTTFLILLTPSFLWMIKNHPYQDFYFNLLINHKNIKNKFEVDYFGTSGKPALEYILDNNNNNNLLVYSPNTLDLNLSLQLINKTRRKRISIKGKESEADFIINNYYDWRGKLKPDEYVFSKDFNLFYELKIDDLVINSIYKRRSFK
jgi:hypothetical protein